MPVTGPKLTEGYIRTIAAAAYVWSWPMVNMHNRRVAFSQVPEPGVMGGVMPCGPLNEIGMLTDYVTPEERFVACPNQDFVYGFGILSLDLEPAVVQVPDVGDRFWVYQIADQRTDAFGGLGRQYDTEPGHHLIVGPDWDGETLTVWASSQTPRVLRGALSTALDLPESRVRVIVPDVGGGFGLKVQVFPGGGLGNALKVPETVKNGVAEMGHTWMGYDWGAQVTTVLFGGYAGSFDTERMLHWIYEAGGAEMQRQFRDETAGVTVARISMPLVKAAA